jgi:hypothetical protein
MLKPWLSEPLTWTLEKVSVGAVVPPLLILAPVRD